MSAYIDQSLPLRMRAAADVLEDANLRCGLPGQHPWTAESLRHEAAHVQAEDCERAEADT